MEWDIFQLSQRVPKTTYGVKRAALRFVTNLTTKKPLEFTKVSFEYEDGNHPSL